MTQFIKKLPAVFQTVTEKKFFDATFDQVFSKKDSDLLSGYIGRRNPGTYNPITDFYLPEPSKNRTWWQLEATAYARDENSNRTNILFYDDLLERIEYYGGNTLNQDRLFESKYYSFGPPIDYDMFTNYENYYWVEQGLPTISITGVLASDIVGQSSYTTPLTATPPGLTLSTGMSVRLVSDPSLSSSVVIENMGGCEGIQLVPKFPDFTAGTLFEFLPWDGTLESSTGTVINNTIWDGATWDTQTQPALGDYLTIQRGAVDRNAWSRTNKWFHIDTVNAAVNAVGGIFPITATRALRPIIQFIANLDLYNSGTQFRSEITYGFSNNLFGNKIAYTDVQGVSVAAVNLTYSVSMSDGDLVVFFNDTDVVGLLPANNYIFMVTVVAGIINLTPYTSSSTPILEGDIVFATEDGPFDGAQRGSTWYFSNGVWAKAYNDKEESNQAPLFQLYDHAGVPLDDPATYPASTFRGSEIFSYKVNSTPGATTDPVLGFPIVYTSLGQSSDIIFQNNLIVDRYTSNQNNINGYYYYKTSTDNTLYNNWNMYDICDCDDIVPTPPVNCVSVSKQRVIDKYTVGYGTEYQFKLSTVPYGYPSAPDIIVSINGTEVKNSTEESGGYTLVVINNNIYVNLVTKLMTLLSTPQAIAPVVEIQTYTHANLDPDATGYFSIPQQLEANPAQLEVSEISASNLISQFSSIIQNQIGFEGSSFGGKNNYRDSRKNRSLGQFILQNTSPALKAMLVSSEDDLDIIKSIRFSSDEYTKFKNKYLSTALQLINQSFSPVAVYNDTVLISYWVGEIFKILNVSKEFSNAFAYSYMAASGTPYVNESISTTGNSLVSLANYIDLSSPKNVMYIYDVTDPDAEELLIDGVDYTIVSSNLSIDIQLNMGISPVDIFVALYKEPLPTYIPSTPTKLGAYKTYIPRVELDTTYAVPTNVIIGHDGSKTIAYGDYRDQLLLELEKRIYNFIQTKFRNEYSAPVRLEDIKSGFFRDTRYSLEEYLSVTESYINKWSTRNRANYRVNDWASASQSTPIQSLWKLYNYSGAITTSSAPTDLPGNWKGIFQYYYDTYYPDTRPWEMLGFGEQPSWWVYEYGTPVLNTAGQEVWTSTATGNSNMWADLEAGIIRQGPSAIYDSSTLTVQPQQTWARPGLSTIIPVDSSGEIISVMTIFGLAYTGNPYAPFDGFDTDWVYGDGGPVEQAWMSTSAYAFSVQEFMYLMKPGPYGEQMWDTYGTSVSPGQLTIPGIAGPVKSAKNWQYVQNDTFSNSDVFFEWFRPKNKDQLVHAELVDGIVNVRSGYQNWISDRILYLNKSVSTVFGQKVRTLDVNLANKFAGFTNKDTTNTYIESISPGSRSSSLILPSNNFEVILHKSPPVKTFSYSGVIIRVLEDGTFVVYGYDVLNSAFTVLDRSTDKLIDVSVGGTPAEFTYYTVGASYNEGDIVRYNGVYYVSRVSQTVGKFDLAYWIKLSALPTNGGISVSYKPLSKQTTSRIPYGSILKTPQDVFDMLIGWEAYLKSQGWQFNEVDQDTNILSDWLSSAKQFLFWLNTSWAPDAAIQLSPLANKATLVVDRGYPSDVETLSNGIYSILDKSGIAIAPNNTSTDRDGQSISIAPNDLASGGIYFVQINVTETEHILIFDNVTSFNDTIYSPLLRARQQRLKFYGFRSNGWYGKMEAPGYMIMGNQMVPNYDTIVDAMRYYYDPDVTIDNPSLEDLGRHLIGYESKSYLDNLQISDDVQYLFYQGAIRQKGTIQAFDKLFRSTKVQTTDAIAVYEEWALKVGDFGNTVDQVSIEFKLKVEQNTGEVIVARLNFIPSAIGSIKHIKILNAEQKYTSVPSVNIPLPDATPDGVWADYNSLIGYSVGSIVNYPNIYGYPVYYSSRVNQPEPAGAFNPSLWDVVLETRIAKAYIVLNSAGVISRIDMIDGGYGYTSAPNVTINSNTTISTDRIYSVWQGQIIKDDTLDNIVNIDIDETDTWLVRPNDPSVALEFPVTNEINYSTPNAGYVNFNDVTHTSFDIAQTHADWGTEKLNPKESETVWVAKNFTEDWGVYKMVNGVSAPYLPNTWRVSDDGSGNLLLLTNTTTLSVISDTGSGAILLPVVNSTGQITSITIVDNGVGYLSTDTIVTSRSFVNTVSDVDATFTIAVNIDGGISNVYALTGGTNYENTVFIPQIWNSTTGERTDLGNLIVLQETAKLDTDPAKNHIVGFVPYLSESYDTPGVFVDPDTLVSYNAYSLTNEADEFLSSNDIADFESLDSLLLFKTMRWSATPNVPNLPTYVHLNDLIWVDNVSGKWSVIQMQAKPGNWDVAVWDSQTIGYWGSEFYNYGWNVTGPFYFSPFRVQEQLIETSFFKSVSVYNELTRNEIVQMPVYDPFKNIMPGPAKQNISYTSYQDPARYNVTDTPRLYDENIIFGPSQVGKLWWDTSSTRYVYYEQPMALDGSETEIDNLVYRRDRWAQLFPGSIITIYEWVSSPVPPSEYTGSGTPKDVNSYVVLTTSNRFTSVTETNYYFWVSGSTDKPNVINRTLAATDVARLLQNPKNQAFVFFAPIQQTATNNSYMFYNAQDFLAYKGDNVQIEYKISARDDQEHTQWSFFREGDSASLVTDQFWNKFVDSICGYTKVLPVSNEFSNSIIVANYLPWDIFGWDVSPYDNATSTTTAGYGMILPVPDPMLASGQLYGIEYRPRQGMFVNLLSARKVFVQASNELLKYISIRDDNPSWNVNVPTSVYWSYTNWCKPGYEDVVPTIVFATLSQANAALVAGDLYVGQTIQVTNGTIDGRYVLYTVTQINPTVNVYSLEEVAIENGAIKLLDTVYTTVNKYGLATELRSLLDAFRTTVMINQNIVDQNKLYFSMLNYVVSEQKNPDWVFKTSYIYIKETNAALDQPLLYTEKNIDDVVSYIKDVKPYHTQIRDYTSTYTTPDIVTGTASDTIRQAITIQFGPDFAGDNYPIDVQVFSGSNIPGWDTVMLDSEPWDELPGFDSTGQYISRNAVIPSYNPGVLSWPGFDESTIRVTLSIPSPTVLNEKKGLSELYPYIADFNSININNPQTFITPNNIVAIETANGLLYYGQDYYVDYNTDTTYTVFFFNDPGVILPVAFVWIDGGHILAFRNYVPNRETANVVGIDNYAIDVDTKEPILAPALYNANISSITYSGLTATVNTIVPHGIVATGTLIIYGVTPSTFNGVYAVTVINPSRFTYTMASVPTANANVGSSGYTRLSENTISYRENVSLTDGYLYSRNADALSGTLVNNVLAPTEDTYNIDVITVFVDPATHPLGTDILPENTYGPVAIWIDGERIEYGQKVATVANTWELRLIDRGTRGTGIVAHDAIVPSVYGPFSTVPNQVWVEVGNIMPTNSHTRVWNAQNVAPDVSTMLGFGTLPLDTFIWDGGDSFSNITSVPATGLWGASTSQATYLKNNQGKANH